MLLVPEPTGAEPPAQRRSIRWLVPYLTPLILQNPSKNHRKQMPNRQEYARTILKPSHPKNHAKLGVDHASWLIEGSCTQLDMADAIDSAEPMFSCEEA